MESLHETLKTELAKRFETERTHLRCLSIAALAIYAILSATLYFWACGTRPWFELFNGATWPPEWSHLYERAPLIFSLTVGLRTVMSTIIPILSVAISFIAYAYYRNARQELAMNTATLLKTLDAEVSANIFEAFQIDPTSQDHQAATEKIKSAIRLATQHWVEQQLPLLIGRDAAKRFMEQEYQQKPV